MDLDFISSFQLAFWVKIATLIVIAFYVIFTFVVFNQVKVMSEILRFPYAKGTLRIIAVTHIILAISLFLLAIVIL